MKTLIQVLTLVSLTVSITYFIKRMNADKALAAGQPCNCDTMKIPPQLMEAAQRLKLELEKRLERPLSLDEVSRYLNKYLQEGIQHI